MSSLSEQPTISVREFVAGAPAQLSLRVLAGAAGLDERRITLARIQKLGLALAGFTHYIHPGRVQIVGQSEIWYLGQLTPERRESAIELLALEEISCVLVTKDLLPPAEFLAAAERAALPLLQTPLVSSVAINLVTGHLEAALAPRELRHGVLVDAYGLGVLLEGESGIGKSECALDLIGRGHRLVADDTIEVRRVGQEQLLGSAPELLREHMEIRGLGIINIRDVFGVAALSGPKQIGLTIRFERWQQAHEVDRLGIDTSTIEILGVHVPHVLLPVSPGRNLATLVETALRVHLLRAHGYNAAERLVARHAELLSANERVHAPGETSATTQSTRETTDEQAQKEG
jgi:HPr kinase/phosphorylase